MYSVEYLRDQSVLGPMLFLIHIADINEVSISKVASFADDTRKNEVINSPEDCDELQRDTEKVYA